MEMDKFGTVGRMPRWGLSEAENLRVFRGKPTLARGERSVIPSFQLPPLAII
jgi:hypothetical protein